MPVPFFSQVASSVRKRFIDTFSSRSTTSGSLDTATDGSRWDATSGTIAVASPGVGLPNVAQATSVPNSGGSGNTYPMATVTMPTGDNTIRIKDVEQGASAAIWVQSSSDWWMVGIDAEFNTIPGNTAYAYAQNAYGESQGSNTSNQFSFTTYAGPAASNWYTSSSNYFSFTNYNASYTAKYGTSGPFFTNGPPTYKYTANGYTVTYGSSTGYGLSTSYYVNTNYYYYASGTGYAYNGVNYFYFTTGGNYFTNSFTNATTYAYSQILRVRQSVGGTVSTITSSVISAVQSAASLLVSLTGNQITAKAYSDNNFVTQLGSDLVYTATGASVNTRFGIAVSPTAYTTAPANGIIGTSVQITRN
jgi:hypothetical protein